MSHQSYSSIGTSRRRGHHPIDRYTDVDRSVYTVGQTLASIVNDPRTAGQTSGIFWGLGHDASQVPTPPPLDLIKYPPVTRADLQQYISLVHGDYERFIRDRQSLEVFDAQHSNEGHGTANQGEPFMAAVQAVPMQFFHESFFEEWDDFFKQYCQEQSADELYEQIDQLNKNLDVVELQLLREVASRSDSFFKAASSLQDLQGMLGSSVSNIRDLRKALAAADEQMCSTAGAVKALQSRKSNLQATLNITKGLEELVAAQQALDCLLEAQDHAGALELLEQMRSLLEHSSLLGLQCVRHLPPRLTDMTAAVESALANEFLSTISNVEVPCVVAQAASDAEVQPDAGIHMEGTGKGPWQLPSTTVGVSSSTAAAAAAAEQLHDKLLPLAVGLYRCDRLSVTLQQYKVNVGDEVKAAVRDAVQQVLPVLLSAEGEVPLSSAHQQAAAEAQLSDQLQLLHHGAFMVLLHAVAQVICCCVDHVVRVGRLLENILGAVNATPSHLSSVRKDCSAAAQVVVDVALARWVKLLSTRGAAHARLKQYELRQLLDLSDQVASYADSQGARIPGSFKAALLNHCKALLDHSHARNLNQLQHLLENEQWGPAEVPGSFQNIVDRMVVRCEEAAALLDGKTLIAAAAVVAETASPVSSGTSSREVSAEGAAATAAATAASNAEAATNEQHSPTLQLSGKSFHLVNSALMLLKMLDEYMSLYELMPQFGAEIVHRELELLKLFNSQTAALVLGAGAMRTAGLRSISAKQLALSCQAVAMIATLLPLLRAGSLAIVSQPRRALLMPEFDRLLQDLTLHVDEVHSKLVDIMKDRLTAAVQALPAELRAAPAGLNQPTQSVVLLSKQLATLRSVLVPLLLKEEVEFIFGAVARAFSDGLSEVFELLMAQETACDDVIRASALHMLQAFRNLSLDPARASNYSSRLTTTYTKHFGLPPWDQEKLGHIGHRVEQQQQQQQRREEQPSNHQEHEQQMNTQQQDQKQSQLVSQEQLKASQDIPQQPAGLPMSQEQQQQQQQHLLYDAGSVVHQQGEQALAMAEQHTEQQQQQAVVIQSIQGVQQAEDHNMSHTPHSNNHFGGIKQQQQQQQNKAVEQEQGTATHAGYETSGVDTICHNQETGEVVQDNSSEGVCQVTGAAASSSGQQVNCSSPQSDEDVLSSPAVSHTEELDLLEQRPSQDLYRIPQEFPSTGQAGEGADSTEDITATDINQPAVVQASPVVDVTEETRLKAAAELPDTVAAAAFMPINELHTSGCAELDQGLGVPLEASSSSSSSLGLGTSTRNSLNAQADLAELPDHPAEPNGGAAGTLDLTNSSLHEVMSHTSEGNQQAEVAAQVNPQQQQQQQHHHQQGGLQNGADGVVQDVASLLVDDPPASPGGSEQSTAAVSTSEADNAADLPTQPKKANCVTDGIWDPLGAANDAL